MFDGHKPSSDIFASYLKYTEATEPPTIYHRWSYLTLLGAAIGRKAYFNHGHFRIFPNLYVMLLGEPAARKSTSIKLAKKLLASAGYSNFAGDKTSKEKFLEDLEGLTEDDEHFEGKDGSKKGKGKAKYDLTTADNLWGGSETGTEPREVFIVADEFNDFAGAGNLDFYTTLGNLWDFDSPDQPFSQRFKSKSITIYQPTVSILSGNTPELFARAFPPEAIGSGFLSRLLLIHGERSGKKITFPPPPDLILAEQLTNYLRKILSSMPGPLATTTSAYQLLDNIYQSEDSCLLTDIRFKAYVNRRFTQLLKICVILAVAKFQTEITDEDVLQANTILSHAEILMPRAMGEFGKSKNSDVANKIIDVLDRTIKPLAMRELWAEIGGVSTLPSMKELVDMVNGLVAANKIQMVQGRGGSGFLPRKAPRKEANFVDWSFLTKEERDSV